MCLFELFLRSQHATCRHTSIRGSMSSDAVLALGLFAVALIIMCSFSRSAAAPRGSSGALYSKLFERHTAELVPPAWERAGTNRSRCKDGTCEGASSAKRDELPSDRPEQPATTMILTSVRCQAHRQTGERQLPCIAVLIGRWGGSWAPGMTLLLLRTLAGNDRDTF